MFVGNLIDAPERDQPASVSANAQSKLRVVTGKALIAKPRGLLSGAELKTGYLPRNEAVDQVLNRGVAAVLIVLAAPLFLSIILLQRLTSREPVFYRGTRLGKNRIPFDIYKFRTLRGTARKLTSGQTLPRRNLTETRLGIYLRASRLDELPQLFNILRGEMVFFGPRPVRPELEALYRAEVSRHDERFIVRPGLVGLSQAIMSHETPKAIRARFNGMCCRTEVNYIHMAGFVTYVGFCVLRKSLRMVGEAASDALSPLGGHRWLQSGFCVPSRSRVEATVGGIPTVGALCGLSDEVMQFVSTIPVPPGRHKLTLVRERRNGRISRVVVDAEIQAVAPVGLGRSGFAQYATYRCNSRLSTYKIERYFLQSAVVPS